MTRLWGASRAPPWGSIVSSREQKPKDLDTILRGAGDFEELAVRRGRSNERKQGGFWAAPPLGQSMIRKRHIRFPKRSCSPRYA